MFQCFNDVSELDFDFEFEFPFVCAEKLAGSLGKKMSQDQPHVPVHVPVPVPALAPAAAAAAAPIPPLKKPPGYSDPNIQIPRPPQPPSNLPPTFYPYTKKKKSNGCCFCYFCFCISLALLLLLLLCLGAFFYVWYSPNLPGFALKSFHLDNFNLTESKGQDADKLNTRMTLKVEFVNANRNIKFSYDKVSMAAINDETGLILAEEIVPGFTQGVNNVTTIKFVLQGSQILVNPKVSKKLADDFRKKSLKLTLETTTGIGMVMANNGWNLRPVWVKLSCGAITLKQLNGGKVPNCRIYVFNLHA